MCCTHIVRNRFLPQGVFCLVLYKPHLRNFTLLFRDEVVCYGICMQDRETMPFVETPDSLVSRVLVCVVFFVPTFLSLSMRAKVLF